MSEYDTWFGLCGHDELLFLSFDYRSHHASPATGSERSASSPCDRSWRFAVPDRLDVDRHHVEAPNSLLSGVPLTSAISTQMVRSSVDRAFAASPVSVIGEHVISCLHLRVARQPALRVVCLRRIVGYGGGPKCIGSRVVLERGPPPPAAVRELPAVLHHEINIMLCTWHRWLTGIRLLFFRVPMDFGHLGAIGERLAVAGHAFLVGVDHYGVAQDHSYLASVLTDRDY